MQLYIIRHAQSVNNAIWVATGTGNGRLPDPPLTDLGHQQAQRLAGHMAATDPAIPVEAFDPANRGGFHLTHLYTSLMLRALQTAHYVAEALDAPLHTWEIIHEWGGIYEEDLLTGERTGQPGLNRTAVAAQFPRCVVPDALGEEGWWNRPFDPYENTPIRAQTFLTELIGRHGGSDDRVAIFTHGGFFQALMRLLLGFPATNNHFGHQTETWVHINNTAVTRLNFDDKSISLVYLNRLEHLPAHLIT